MLSIKFLFWLLLPIIVNSLDHKKPIIQEILQPKINNLNQLRINCDLEQGVQPLKFEWYHNNKKLEDNNKITIKTRDDSAVLIIKTLSVDDLGDYKCIARNSYGEHSQKVSFHVNFKPQWVKEPEDIVSSLSKEVLLQCKSNGYPLPTNKWIKLSDDKKTIVNEFQPSDTIKFELTKETSGYYKCISSNSIGSIQKIINVGYYEINCFEEGKPIIEELISSSKLIEGKKYYLECNLGSGKALNTFEWYFNGQKVLPNDNITIIQHDDFSKLNIKSMNLDYSGDYTCKVTNSFGYDSQTISIKLKIKPRWIVEPIDIQTKLHSKFSTKCEANGIPMAKIKWIKLSSNGNEMIIDNDELHFQNFTRLDASNYKCLAENELGKIEKTIKITYYGNVFNYKKVNAFW